MGRPLHHFASDLRAEQAQRFETAATTLAARLDRLPDDHPDRVQLGRLVASARAAAKRYRTLAAEGR